MNTHSPESRTYEKTLAEHQELKDLLKRIDEATLARSGTIAEVGDLLALLGDRLVKRFAMEEDGSYFGDALLHAPQLVSKANRLLAQHPKMCVQADKLLAEVRTAPERADWWERTRKLFVEFRDELLLHERQEDRLLQEAYGQDIGSHD